MQGEVGTLNRDGVQIGGFYDWEISLSLIRLNGPDGQRYKSPQIKAVAKKYFYFTDITDDLTADYYQLINGKLVLMASHSITLSGREMSWMN